MTSAQSRPASQARISIEPYAGRVVATFSDAIVASTDRAKVLRQEGEDPIFYFPPEDIYFEFLEKTNHVSRSPVMGEATWWRASAVGKAAEDAMWIYQAPNPVASALAGHGAFDQRRVKVEAIPAQDWQHTPHIVE